MRFEKAHLGNMQTAMSWVTTEEEARNWIGSYIEFPFNLHKVHDEMKWEKSGTFVLREYLRQKVEVLYAFGQINDKDEIMTLARIIVDPLDRHKGYGAMFCNELIEYGYKNYGNKDILLNVYFSNFHARSLYIKLGFENFLMNTDKKGFLYMTMKKPKK